MFISVLLTAFFFTQTFARTCYFLDGSEAIDDVPCSSNQYTNCCSQDDICMSNGLCFIQGQRGFSLSRGSCTDQNWGSNCTAPCRGYNNNNGFPIINLIYHGNISTSQFCCGDVVSNGTGATCANEETPFTLDAATAVIGYAALTTSSTTTTSTSSSGASSTGSSVLPSTTLLVNVCPSNRSTSATTIVANDSSCHETAVGAGVGVPLGVVALSALIWAFWERRRLLKRASPLNIPTMQKQDDGLKISEASADAFGLAELDQGRPRRELMDTSGGYK